MEKLKDLAVKTNDNKLLLRLIVTPVKFPGTKQKKSENLGGGNFLLWSLRG